MTRQVTVIIPARNEASVIGNCLSALVEEGAEGWRVGVVVVANACTDDTAAVAELFRSAISKRGWSFSVVETGEPGKSRAINRGERAASDGARIFLDADTVICPGALAAVLGAISTGRPTFATARLAAPRPRSLVSRLYGRTLLRLPYFADGDAGSGFFAVNGAGRARWTEVPDIIADDVFMRSHFSKAERVVADAGYFWPLPEGWNALLRVRRRQEVGLRQLKRIRPAAVGSKRALGARLRIFGGLLLGQPLATLVFASVVLTAKLTMNERDTRWASAR